MKVLIVGSGGREHALAWKLNQSQRVGEILIAPGNGGTAQEGENVPVKAGDIPALVDLAKERAVDLVVAGPEEPLVLGLTNALANESIPCFGPDAYAANLEGSKAFSKHAMAEAGVPTAPFAVFDQFDQASAFVEENGAPVVIKADGLAAGKGVVAAKSVSEAIQALERTMLKREFGAAGERVVVETALRGEEASFLAFSDGEHVALLPSSQDHKPIFEHDEGPNTGGMGAYSPAPVLPESDYQKVSEASIVPVIRHMASSGHPYTGILYAGLMFTDHGPQVLEYNVRFGDPECQPLLMRLDCDLAEVMLACVEGRLDQVELGVKPETSVCVVMAAQGYPGSYPKGMEIRGIEEAETLDQVKVFHAGTKAEGGKVYSTGGRVLGVTALGADLAQARERAYEAVQRIQFDNSHYRTDIGAKGLGR
jgi:phosphoribosylamine--glycine ligase